MYSQSASHLYVLFIVCRIQWSLTVATYRLHMVAVAAAQDIMQQPQITEKVNQMRNGTPSTRLRKLRYAWYLWNMQHVNVIARSQKENTIVKDGGAASVYVKHGKDCSLRIMVPQ